jgi:hypothetical protein
MGSQNKNTPLQGMTGFLKSAASRIILTPADHGLLLHAGARGFVTIAQCANGSWRERGVPIADLSDFLRHLDPAPDTYISQNRFDRPCRRIAYLLHADALFSGLGFYITEFKRCDPRFTLDFVLRLLDDAKIPPPTFATSTEMGHAMITALATCLRCGATFTPRRTGGSAQRFCAPRHRNAFWAATRRWVVAAIASGALTIEDLRCGPPAACTLLGRKERGSPVPETGSDPNGLPGRAQAVSLYCNTALPENKSQPRIKEPAFND